jgi:hypothetical protein
MEKDLRMVYTKLKVQRKCNYADACLADQNKPIPD